MPNELIFSSEQHVFIYDQYLIQSASQFQCTKLNLCSMTELLVGIYGLFVLLTWPFPHPCDFYLWGRLKNAVYKSNPHTLEELKCNIRDKINNINRGELQRVIGNFIKRCQKMVGQRRWAVPAPPSIKLVSTTICKIQSFPYTTHGYRQLLLTALACLPAS